MLVKDFFFPFEFVVQRVKKEKESKGGKGRDGDREKKVGSYVDGSDAGFPLSQQSGKEENKEKKKRKLPVTSPRQRHVRQ